jgi:hypothetical protein
MELTTGFRPEQEDHDDPTRLTGVEISHFQRQHVPFGVVGILVQDVYEVRVRPGLDLDANVLSYERLKPLELFLEDAHRLVGFLDAVRATLPRVRH